MNANLNVMRLPEIEAVRRRCMALAMLDAIMCPAWEDRYYSFNPNWSAGEQMASMRNGQGDEWFMLFGCGGAALKGYAHESRIEKTAFAKRIQAEVPASLHSFLCEPAFSLESATFCYWRRADDAAWSSVRPGGANTDDADGSTALLALLIDTPDAYQQFAFDYYGETIPLETIEALYDLAPLTKRFVTHLNPGLTATDTLALANEIGYPVQIP